MPQLDLIADSTMAPSIKELIEAAPMPGLGPGPTCDATRKRIESAVNDSVLRGTLAEAGLWLLAGELDRSHQVSQADGSAEGSFWHGIMHRREGDYWNSKYWFRKVSRHPVHQQLAQEVKKAPDAWNVPTKGLIEASTVAESLVDRVEQAQQGKDEWVEDLQKIAWWEWQLLFAHCIAQKK